MIDFDTEAFLGGLKIKLSNALKTGDAVLFIYFVIFFLLEYYVKSVFICFGFTSFLFYSKGFTLVS